MTNPSDKVVAEFILLKQKLIDWCDDPDAIEALAQDDLAFREICLELYAQVMTLQFSHQNARDGIISPTNRKFIKEWRDYEKRLSRPIAGVVLMDLGVTLEGHERASTGWDWAEEDGREQSRAVQNDINHLMHCIEYDSDAYGGGYSLRRLLRDGPLDLRGIFRRLHFAPMLLVPQEAARRMGGEEVALLTLWREARVAFIFGAPHAAIALCRALLEKLLTRFYGARGEKLEKLIIDFETRVRKERRKDNSEFHRIRMVANAILHSEQKLETADEVAYKRRRKIVESALSDIEREVATSLRVVQSLIEDFH